MTKQEFLQAAARIYDRGGIVMALSIQPYGNDAQISMTVDGLSGIQSSDEWLLAMVDHMRRGVNRENFSSDWERPA